jgi:hypothetical protein
MGWSVAGLGLALAVGAIALRCSRSPGGFYDRGVYGMSAASHRRYATISLAFAVYFAATFAFRYDVAGIAGLALYALVAVFYAASFLQGAPDE